MRRRIVTFIALISLDGMRGPVLYRLPQEGRKTLQGSLRPSALRHITRVFTVLPIAYSDKAVAPRHLEGISVEVHITVT